MIDTDEYFEMDEEDADESALVAEEGAHRAFAEVELSMQLKMSDKTTAVVKTGTDTTVVDLPAGGVFVKNADGSQTIKVGGEFATVNADGTISASKSIQWLKLGDDSVLKTADGHKIVIGAEGIKSFTTAKGEHVDLPKKEVAKEIAKALEPQKGDADKEAQERLDSAVKQALEGKLDADTIQDLCDQYGKKTDIVMKINLRLEAEGSNVRLKKSEPMERPGAEGVPGVNWQGFQYSLTKHGTVVNSATVWRTKK